MFRSTMSSEGEISDRLFNAQSFVGQINDLFQRVKSRDKSNESKARFQAFDELHTKTSFELNEIASAIDKLEASGTSKAKVRKLRESHAALLNAFHSAVQQV